MDTSSKPPQQTVPTPPVNRAARPGLPGPGRTQPKLPPRRSWVWFVLMLVLNYFLMRSFFPSATAPVKVPYTLFKDEVAKSNVQAIYSRGEIIMGRFLKAVNYTPTPRTEPKNPTPTPAPREVRNF